MDKYTSTTIDGASIGLKKQKVTTFTAVFMVFSLVAAGCYGIEEMIPSAGMGLTLVMLIVIPFIWGLPFGLVASELGSARPQEGGYYKWVQEALGEFWGFQAGWWRTISIYIDNTLYVVLAGGYLFSMVQTDSVFVEFAFKAAMILVFMYINLRGVRDVGLVTNALSIFIIAAFAMVAILGFMNWGGNPFAEMTPEPVEAAVDWIFYVGAGLSIGMWMYSGYESMSTFAGELKDPQVIPKATLITVPLIMLTYILPTMAGASALNGTGDPELSYENWGIDPESVGYATVADVFWGPAAGIFFGIVAVIAQFSIYNTYIASGSRGFFALSEDNLSPKFFTKISKKYGVPYITVISIAVVNLALCMIDFTVLIIVDVFLLVSSYIMVYISAIILRNRLKKEEYKFRLPIGPKLFKVLCIVPIVVAVISFLINGSDYFFGGMIGIISGPVLYFVWKRYYGGLAKKDPEGNPINTKTKLALGDTKRLAILFGLLAFVGVLGCLFLPWYEQDWVYPALADFEGKVAGFEVEVEADYDLLLFSSKEALYMGIRIMTIASAGLAAIFGFVARAIEPKKAA